MPVTWMDCNSNPCPFAQLRIPPEQWLAPNMYKRGDGTLAYFFSIDELSGLARRAGFVVEECRYVCVISSNKKRGLELKRVFVHGVFRKPGGVKIDAERQ
eukprot:303980-Chlamydomonas_euryale.AAC.29